MNALTKVVAVIAVGLVLAGLVVGFGVGITDESGFDCGSAFKESSDLYSDQLVDTMTGGDGSTGCDAARGSAKPLPIVLLVLGGVAGAAAGVLIVEAKKKPTEQAA